MKDDPNALRREIRDQEEALLAKMTRLEYLERTCQHEWGPVTYDPITLYPAGECGDEPGTMGVDYRPKRWYPATMQDAWSRTCKRCGKTEHTTRVIEEVKRTPKF